MKNKIIFVLVLLLAVFLRIYNLESNPPGFYSDEASYSYNAYSILKTGRDEHGVFLPLATEAFGDYKLPVMLYSIAISFGLLGPNDFAARLPGALYGSATVFLLYFLVKEIRKNRPKDYLPLIAAAFLAITPGHIFVSRGTWELTPALFFITLATLFFLKAVNSVRYSTLKYAASSFFFILSIYSYNSARVFVPLFAAALIIIYRDHLKEYLSNRQNLLYALLILCCGFALCLPIIKSIRSPEVIQRAKYISIFYNKGVEAHLFDAIRSDSGQLVKITQALHNKPLFYFMDFTNRYLSHFDLNFLFTTGDTFELFRLIGLGFLPIILLPVLIIGLYSLLKEQPSWFYPFFFWLIISPIASSFTIFTPSLSRSQNLVIPLVVFSAYGALYSYHWLKSKTSYSSLILPAAIAIYSLNTVYIFRQYFFITPTIMAQKWNDGFKEQVQYIMSVQNNYDRIVISSSQAPSYIFYAWFGLFDPSDFQQNAVVDHTPDSNGLIFTSKYKKYLFTKNISQTEKNITEGERVLYVGFPGEVSFPTKSFYSRDGNLSAQIKE